MNSGQDISDYSCGLVFCSTFHVRDVVVHVEVVSDVDVEVIVDVVLAADVLLTVAAAAAAVVEVVAS